ncbi:MAG: DUF4258 domain-containing protein [Thermomicrobiales bacterium]|nr:DUF4258 domain-containing protein [Thermomicrobiales bacterium]
MTKQEALDMVRHCLEEGNIRLLKHFRDELRNERLVFEDARHVLRYGQIYDPPEQDLRRGDWRYRVEGKEPGGKWLAIIVSFEPSPTAVLVTVFSVRR